MTRSLGSLLLAAAMTLAIGGCGGETTTYVSALTGQACEPNGSFMPHPSHNPRCQGTSNGDNCDDLSSGKIDCIGDGNSGQGDDKKHDCMFPQPGCDDTGCCDGDVVEPPGDDDVPPDDGDPAPDGGTTTPPPDDGPIVL